MAVVIACNLHIKTDKKGTRQPMGNRRDPKGQGAEHEKRRRSPKEYKKKKTYSIKDSP